MGKVKDWAQNVEIIPSMEEEDGVSNTKKIHLHQDL